MKQADDSRFLRNTASRVFRGSTDVISSSTVKSPGDTHFLREVPLESQNPVRMKTRDHLALAVQCIIVGVRGHGSDFGDIGRWGVRGGGRLEGRGKVIYCYYYNE